MGLVPIIGTGSDVLEPGSKYIGSIDRNKKHPKLNSSDLYVGRISQLMTVHIHMYLWFTWALALKP